MTAVASLAETARELGEALGGESSSAHGSVVVDVEVQGWHAAATLARDGLGFRFFDWLTAVDDGAAGLAVVLSLWSSDRRLRLLLRCRLLGTPPSVPSVADVFPGAGWAEREAVEMFGLEVSGHPSPGPLLLPEGFEGHPLRKDFVLAARAARPWPGAVEPGGGSRRRPPVPPGVPGPGAFPSGTDA